MRIKILFKYLKLMKRRLPLYMLSILFMTAFGALFDVACSMVTKNVFVVAQKGVMVKNDVVLFAVYIVAGFVAVILAAVFMKIYNNEAKRGSLEIKQLVFAKSIRLPMRYYDIHHSGEIMSKFVYETDMANDIYGSRLRRVLTPIISVAVYVIVMMQLCWSLTLTLLLFNVLIVVLNGLLAKPMSQVGKAMADSNAKMTEKLTNILSGIEVKKLYDSKYINEDKYAKESNVYVSHQKKKMVIGALLETFYNGFDLLCALLFLVVAIAFIQNDWVSVGNVAAIYTMYGALSIRFLQFGKSYPELMNCLAYAERVFEFLQIDEERDILNSETTVRVINCENAVEVVDISFSYDGKCKVFEKRSLLIEKNKTVAIVGKSGGGKSTLAKLMLGFYNIQEGDILLFGTSIKKLGLINARNLIAYIPQEPYLFGVSIKENIRYGNLKASDEEIIIAAKHANAHDFIMNQKEGYDTLIINGGKSLSGGERQRIAIARAIIKDAPIILMDEATSALDNESERRIHEALEQLKHNKTVIVIAHRPETINIADTVVEV